MVVDTLHLKSQSAVHPSINILGKEIVIDLPIPTLLLALLGAGVALKYLLSFLRLIAELTVIPGRNINSYKSKTVRSYALVTGCTSGIGLEWARQLAGKGFNLILVGRREAALSDLSKEISSKYKVQAKFLTIDLADPVSREAGFSNLRKMAEDLDLAVLINNAATSHEVCTPFLETTPGEMETIIQANVIGTLHLTRTVLPFLVARSSTKAQRKAPKSLIINVGSLDGRIPPPLLSVYGLTKAGLATWTKALAWELKGSGVEAYVVQPAFVISNMSKIRRASLTVPTAKAWVKSALSSIGLPRGAQGRISESTPYWSHAFMDYMTGLFGYPSEWAGLWVVDYMHRDIRRRWLRKKAREAGQGKKAE